MHDNARGCARAVGIGAGIADVLAQAPTPRAERQRRPRTSRFARGLLVEEHDILVELGLVACLVFMTPLLVASVLWGGDLVRFFVDDPEAIRLGDIMFKITSPSVLMFGLYLVLTGAFQGAGATKVIMVLAIVRLWVLRVPLAYVLARLASAGPLSIWYAMFASNSLTALAGFIYYRRGAWLGALKARGL